MTDEPILAGQFYHVRPWHPLMPWEPAELIGDKWWLIGNGRPMQSPPAIIGPRITPPGGKDNG